MLYKVLLRPLLFQRDPESIHDLAMRRLSAHGPLLKMGRPWFVYDDPLLHQTVMGLSLANPVGLAAGFDKMAMAIPAWAHLGFGFCEIGTVTGQRQPGNDKPRLFRLPTDQALINRFGFNNDGAEKTAARMAAGHRSVIPLGINIGKTKITAIEHAVDDYVFSFRTLWPHADYFAVNVSSPNTPGLRELQDRPFLTDLLQALRIADRELAGPSRGKPILVKIAPDLSYAQIDDVLRVIEDTGIAGLIATNTTVTRDNLRSPETLRSEAGGLSGRPLRQRSTEIIRHIRRQMADRIVLVGVGGIFSAEDAYEKITAGASLIQVYTGFVYEGPGFCRKLNRRLATLLRRDGFSSLSDAIGSRLPTQGTHP